MLVRVKAQKSLQRKKKPYETRGKILCSFKAPSSSTNGLHLRESYERPPVERNGNHTIQVSWHGNVHNPKCYK